MDLTTTYLGFELPHPFLPGASAMSEDLGLVRRLEDAGAAAICLHSLFEEQLLGESLHALGSIDRVADTHAEALSYFPTPEQYRLGPDEYLEHVRKVKDAVAVPVIGSLNGSSLGGWLEYGKLIQQAGADALELNVYHVATDLDEDGATIEDRLVSMVEAVKEHLAIPVAVKLSPFFTSTAHLARRLVAAGADGLVLFNRFYQPDINIEELEVERSLRLSDSSELLLRLRWLAILSGRLDASLAVTGGVHTPSDAIKAIMCGADAVQLVSALLLRSPDYLATIRQDVADWMERFEYESLRQMKGSMSLERCPDPQAYERGNYMQVLKSYQV